MYLTFNQCFKLRKNDEDRKLISEKDKNEF